MDTHSPETVSPTPSPAPAPDTAPTRRQNPFTRERRIKGLRRLESLYSSFSITEKAIFLLLAATFSVACLSLAHKVSSAFMVEVPKRGSALVEGVVGTPRFVNPLLAVSDADKDLASLVYSGLLKATPSGGYVADLAERYEVSEDGLVYTFVIRSDATFHDGKPVTADDVEFTVLKAQDPTLKSPRQIAWEGVSVEKRGSHEVAFVLKQPYASFLSNLTMGIMPKHVWQGFTSEQIPFSSNNVNAVGSGPYAIKGVKASSLGIPESVTLRANEDYALGEPYISTIVMRFYANPSELANALIRGEVQSASNLSADAAALLPAGERLVRTPLTRVFSVFFNQNQKEIFAHKEVRQAIDLAVGKQALIDSVLGGFGTVALGPLPPGESSSTTVDRSIDEARAVLEAKGWAIDPETGVYGLKPSKTAPTSTLSFSLSTANIPELVAAANIVQADLAELGAEVSVKVFETSDLNQSVIRPRKYEALLFGAVTGRDPDLYAFWHSSQRNDPGLNVALYTNSTADKLLESMRKETDKAKSAELYEKFAAEVEADKAAIFLWSPDFIYAVPEALKGMEIGQITSPSDRFLSIERWYVDTDRVWKVFAGDRNEIEI